MRVARGTGDQHFGRVGFPEDFGGWIFRIGAVFNSGGNKRAKNYFSIVPSCFWFIIIY